MKREKSGRPNAPTVEVEQDAENGAFQGFPEASFAFLEALEVNNRREWFAGMRAHCEASLFHPSQSFIDVLGRELSSLHPQLVYDARTDGKGSLFRLARDTRFSKDKSPYKTNLGFRFWLSPEARRAGRIGLYVHLDKTGVRVYGGAHRLAPEELAVYRAHVAVERHAVALRRILGELEQQGYGLEAERLARMPRGYAGDHAAADLLVYKSLFARSPPMNRTLARSPRLVAECTARAARLKPLNDWFSSALSP